MARRRNLIALMAVAFVALAASCTTPPASGGSGGSTTNVTVVASGGTFAYGTHPIITASYIGLSGAPSTPPVCTTDETATSPVGVYTSTCSGAAGAGLTFTYQHGTVFVTQAPVTVTASTNGMVVGGEPPTITPSYSGLKNGQTQPAVLPSCSTNATPASPAGTYASTCSGAQDPNYLFSYVPGVVNNGTAGVTITASSATTTYGDPIPPITPAYDGFTGGQVAPGGAPAHCSTTATSHSPAGTYPTTCTGAVDANYGFLYVSGSVVISPAPLTVTASSGSSIYGGSAPTVTASYTGLKNGDSAPATTATCSNGALSSSHVGTYVTTCSGASDPNYAITYTDGSSVVSAAPVTVTAPTLTVRSGLSLPALTPVYAGLQLSATAPSTPAECTTSASSSSADGDYVSTCSGAVDSDYTFSYIDGTITVTSGPLPVTVTASSSSVQYGGSIPPVTVSYHGLDAGQTAPATPATCSSSATASSGAGTYATHCSGAVDSTYTFTYVDGTTTITPAPLTITASSSTTDHGTIPPITASYVGLQHGDHATATAPTCSTTATTASPAGTYPTSCTGAVDSNYTITYVPGVLTIAAGTVTVKASNGSAVYAAGQPTITPTYTGFLPGQLAPAHPPTCTSSSTSTSPVGSYVSSCTGATDPNYTFAYVNGIVNITKAPLSIKASTGTMVYGAAVPTITPIYTGLKNGAVGTTTAPVCITTATSASPVGTYPTTCSGAADGNYALSYVAGTMTVTAAPLTVTGGSPTITYGAAIPTISPVYTGLQNGAAATATPATCTTTATGTSGAGSYATTCSGAVDSNYTIAYAAGSLTIGKAPVVVTASSDTFRSTQNPPTITPSYSGFIGSQTTPATAPTCSTTATVFSSPGTFPSSCSGAADPNHSFTYVNGVVTVTTAPPTGYAAYTAGAHVTTSSVAGTLPLATITAVNPTGNGFAAYVNLTVQSSNGPQSVFCTGVSATVFGTCIGGTGTISVGSAITDAAVNTFDAYTVIPGGAAAVAPTSLTIVSDVPAVDRSLPTTVAATASNGLVKYTQSGSPSGIFSLQFGYCAPGHTTYSAADSSCSTGFIKYAPTSGSNMGQAISVSGVTQNEYQIQQTAVISPSTVSQGSTFTQYIAPQSGSVPAKNPSSVGDVTVNYSSTYRSIFPIPAGMTFVSASLQGGDAVTRSNASVSYCSPTAFGDNCDAHSSTNYSWTGNTYIEVQLDPAQHILANGTVTMPTIVLTLQATGAIGTVGNTQLTETVNVSNATAPIVGTTVATFDGYPTSGSADVTPPKAAPFNIWSVTITA